MKSILSFLCLLSIGITVPTEGSVESGLRAKLFKNYDNLSLPINPTTNVSMRFHVLHVNIDEERQELLLESWVSMEWYDYRLSWDKDEVPFPSITVPPKYIWTPDITVYNSVDVTNLDLFTTPLAIIYSGGKVLWIPTASVSASCPLDLTYWPNDVQNCTVEFGSWVHSAHSVDLYQKDDHVEFEILKETPGYTGPWTVVSDLVTKKSTEYAVGTYVSLKVNLVLERYGPAYCWTVKVPAFGISLLPLLLFLLPPSSSEKIVTGVLIIILEVMFLGITGSILKQSSAHTPLIVELISEQFLLTIGCVFVSCLILRLAKDPSNTPLPKWIRNVLSLLSCVCCLTGYRQLITKASRTAYPHPSQKDDLELEGRAMMTENGTRGGVIASSNQAEWIVLAAVLDRFFVILYLVLFVIKLINYSAVM